MTPEADEFHGLYTLTDRDEPARCYDIHTWAEWMVQHDRRVAPRLVLGETITVDTVFVGSDPRAEHLEGRAPMLWETLVIGGRYHGEVTRYWTRKEALAGHDITCRRVTAAYELGRKA